MEECQGCEEKKQEFIKLESWITREINISLDQIKKSTHYVKARNEAYVLALKKIQAKVQRTL